jgi:hypothetical protein
MGVEHDDKTDFFLVGTPNSGAIALATYLAVLERMLFSTPKEPD